MATTASFINWNNDPLTRIPCSRARDRAGQLHPKGCECDACRETLQAAKDLLRSNIERLSGILGLGRPEVLERQEPSAAALYHEWFALRDELIKGVHAGRLEYPPREPDEIRRLRRDCGDGRHGVWIPPGLSREALEATAVLARWLSWNDDQWRTRGSGSGAGFNERAGDGVYRQPERITRFHSGRSRGRALAAKGAAAYRSN